MKTKHNTIPILLAALIFAGCATLQPGADPVVVRAEQTTRLAIDTFNLIESTEYKSYAYLKSIAPEQAAQIRGFVNNLRKYDQDWLESARSLTRAYKANRTPENKASMLTAVAVLESAISESQKYLAMMSTTHAWLSYQLAENINRK